MVVLPQITKKKVCGTGPRRLILTQFDVTMWRRILISFVLIDVG